MGLWDEATTELEKMKAALTALDMCNGNQTRAALRLEMHRETLNRRLKVWGGTDELRRKVDYLTREPATRHSDTRITPVMPDDPHGPVMRNCPESWNHHRSMPTFPVVENATIEAEEELVNVELFLPRRIAAWLDEEAIRRKHATRASRAAKSPIVTELIEAAMARGPEGGDE